MRAVLNFHSLERPATRSLDGYCLAAAQIDLPSSGISANFTGNSFSVDGQDYGIGANDSDLRRGFDPRHQHPNSDRRQHGGGRA